MYLRHNPVTTRSPVTRHLICVVTVIIMMLPGLLSAQNLIDEKMPASIPEQIIADWKDQDNASSSNYKSVIEGIIQTLNEEYKSIVQAELDKGANENAYLVACHYRRISKLKLYDADIQKLIYAKHHNLGGIIVGCQEGFSSGSFMDPNKDEKWKAGAGLYYLEFKDYYPQPKALLEDKTGVIRDPCVSLDGKKVAFAWYKNASTLKTGYKIFELDIEKQLANSSNTPKQITFGDSGLAVSDYEPCYTQFGEIIFNSSRCFQLIDCYINMVSTFYAVDTSGKYLRRIGYDQVHAFNPQLRSDGKILYTRWEYNDRNLMQSMGLFTMNPDGTEQNEFYGNQTEWPVTIIHGREIPYTNGSKVIAIASGHHAPYYGEPLIIDIKQGRNGLKPITFVAPKRTYTKAPGGGFDMSVMDSGGVDFKFAHPLPLDEDGFIISWTPTERGIMKLYFMDADGKRELLAWADQSVSQAVPVKARKVNAPKSTVDYKKKTGIFKMENVYVAGGNTLSGVEKGTIKKIRVVKLEYRHSAPDADAWNYGMAGANGWVFLPIARYTGSWQAKRIVGEAKVYDDGSASFEVPANQPLYFQLIDANGNMIQTMRSWSTLMPGETFNCIGCHEDKNTAIPDPTKMTEAGEAKPLDKFYNISDSLFRYLDIIQPILDAKCVKCHSPGKLDLRGDLDTINDANHRDSKKKFALSYKNLTKGSDGYSGNGTYIKWLPIFSANVGIRPKQYGSLVSPLITKILPNHKSKEGFSLTQEELDKICAWIDLCIPHWGLYNEGYTKSSDSTTYDKAVRQRNKHLALEALNIQKFIDEKNGVLNGGTEAVFDNRYSNKINNVAKIPLRFIDGERKLVFLPSSTGELKVNDLIGRQLVNIRIEQINVGTSMSIPLPASLSRGVYIARLKDRNGIQSCKISIMQ